MSRPGASSRREAALFGAERRLPSNLSTGAGVAGLALGSDHENRWRMSGPSKGGRAASRRVDRRLLEAYDAVIDGIIHDTYDPSRCGIRCLYDYFTQGTGAGN